MDQYVTGAMIKKLREQKGLTQLQLAERLGVSDKSISKWETGRGYPDISLVESLAQVLGVSLVELFAGELTSNENISGNMLKGHFYVCPVCGNVVFSTGETVVSCHGITLPPLEAEMPDEKHMVSAEIIEDEYYVTADHEMSKKHFISFFAVLSDDGLQMKKLYPEGPAEAYFKKSRFRWLYYYCSHHGLFRVSLLKK